MKLNCSMHLVVLDITASCLVNCQISFENVLKISRRPLKSPMYNSINTSRFSPQQLFLLTVHKRYFCLVLFVRMPTILNVPLYFSIVFFFFFFFFFFGGGWGGGLWPFQEYFTYIELILHQRWAKTGEPREKNHLTIRKQNFAFPHMTQAGLEPQRWET